MNTNHTNCYRGPSRYIVLRRAIVKISGSASGVNARNENCTAVASNLTRDFNCSPDSQRPERHPFIGGTLNCQPGSRLPRLIYYGNGTSCDLNATLAIGNATV